MTTYKSINSYIALIAIFLTPSLLAQTDYPRKELDAKAIAEFLEKQSNTHPTQSDSIATFNKCVTKTYRENALRAGKNSEKPDIFSICTKEADAIIAKFSKEDKAKAKQIKQSLQKKNAEKKAAQKKNKETRNACLVKRRNEIRKNAETQKEEQAAFDELLSLLTKEDVELMKAGKPPKTEIPKRITQNLPSEPSKEKLVKVTKC